MNDDLLSYASQREYIDGIRLINRERSERSGKPQTYFTQTFGCQQNESDTEKINGMLSDMGFVPTETRDEADVIIYNTCAVREHAEQRVFGTIGALVHIKRKNPAVVIGFCGCMMQQSSVSDELKKKYKHVNLVFGTHAISHLPENLYKAMTGTENVYDVENTKGKIVEDIPVKRGNGLKAWVSVMFGCNNFCSYCIVPYVRGRERSRKPEDVINEVRQLVSEGYKDITLLGQNVNSYHNDLGKEWNFARLLRELNAIDGDFRLRFMTSHPKDATHELIDTIAECQKVCKHLHLPFQSGSDRVLSLMNRRYTRNTYKELIDYAKAKIPGLVLTSDVIVGFPTETDEDFDETLSLVDEIGFEGLYTFIYSIRKGTPAANMEQVPDAVKHERFTRLLDLQTRKAFDINSEYIGKTVRVLVEGFTDETQKTMTGRTDGNIIVNFPSCNAKPGEYKDITIDKALNWALFGNAI